MTDYLTTPTILSENTLLRDGCPLHYWTGGPVGRPWLVFMHGATMDHRMFNAQVEAFAADYRVLVWDARGHGKSQPIGAGFSLQRCAEDMLAILDVEGVDRAILARVWAALDAPAGADQPILLPTPDGGARLFQTGRPVAPEVRDTICRAAQLALAQRARPPEQIIQDGRTALEHARQEAILSGQASTEDAEAAHDD